MVHGSICCRRKGITIASLQPANCGFTVAWSDVFRNRFEGQPLKGTEFRFGDQAIRGEAIITRTGIEGGAIYALSAELREAIAETGEATLAIALRPDLDAGDLTKRLSAPRGKQSLSNFLRKAANLVAGRDRAVAGGGDCLGSGSWRHCRRKNSPR